MASDDLRKPKKTGAPFITAEYSEDSLLFTTGQISFNLPFRSIGIRDASGKAVTFSHAAGSAHPDESGYLLKNAFGPAAVNTGVICADNIYTIIQDASAPSGGISGVSFMLHLPDKYNVIVPAWNGVRLSREHPRFWTGWTSRVVYGGTDLQMQMLLLEGETGGTVIYADDCTQFKAFTVVHRDGFFDICIETIPQAPFTGYKSFSAIGWKIVPYAGDWTNGAAVYRDYVNKAFRLDKIYSQRPAWADDICLAVLTDIEDTAELDVLAKTVDPKKVLLQIPGWRKEPYDVNWPDYTPKDGIREKIGYAHKLGFRVQLHCNMNGFQLQLPEYKRFSDVHVLDSFSLKYVNEEYTTPWRHYFFAQLNPASSEWRKFAAGRISEAVKELNADAVHLDQSLLCYNDGNGYIDGLTSLQGNVLYHKELLEALPEGVLLGGEGITDMNARYGTFLQSHVYAVDNMKLYTDMAEQIVPLTTAVYSKVISYQWPGLPVTANADYYMMWYLTGTAIGHYPTLMRESAHSLSAGANDVARMVINEANWYAKKHPVKLFDGWKKDTVMRWRLCDGSTAVFRKLPDGYVLLGNEEDENSIITKIAVTAGGTVKVAGYYDNY